MKGEYLKTAIAACLVMSAMIAGTVSFGFFMDPVTSDLGFDRSTFSLYFSLITIVGTITLPIYGKLIMKYGTRRFVICGGIWTGLVMAAFSLCDSLVTFYIVGCLVGLGFFGCSYAVVPVIVNAWFVEKNGSVMGATAACGGIVAMVLSMVFPMLIESMGWRTGYIFLGVVVFLLTVPAGALLLHSAPEDVGLEPYGAETNGGARAAETHEESGMSYGQALKSPKLWATVASFLLLAVTVTVTQHLAAYFVSVGFSALMAGIFMSVISAGIIVTNPLAGVLADKMGLMKAFLLCSALYLVSFILLPSTGSIALVCIALLLMSIGNANTSVFAPMVTGSIFGQRDYAAIWGLVSMACVLGQAIGAPLWGLAYDLTESYSIGMYISAVVVAIAFVILAVAQQAGTRTTVESEV